jgi:hypothetical protein
MKKVGAKYWIELTVITLLLIGLGWVAFHFIWPGKYPPFLWLMLAVLVTMTASGQVILTRALGQKFGKFNSTFMIVKTLKFFILLACMIVYLLIYREYAVPFLGSALLMYLVFMIFESRSLNRHSRSQAQQ